MARTPSTMVALGTPAPGFDLDDVLSGRRFTLNDFTDKSFLLVMFVCRHCPFVVHIADELGRLSADYAAKDVAIVGISSNDVTAYPDDAPPRLREFAIERKWQFPVLYDSTQEVARAYDAACTPDFFLFDSERKLVYRGRLDGASPGNSVPCDGRELRRALDDVLAGREAPSEQNPSIGCNIKWRAAS